MDSFTRRMVALGLAAPLALAVLAGCGKNTIVTPVPATPLSSVVITPDDTTLTVGQIASFSAVTADTDSVVVTGVSLTWTSTNAGVFTVTSAGVVTARGEGSAELIAAGGGQADTSTVHVQPPARGWFAQSSGLTTKLNGVYFRPDGRHGWAVGDAGRILTTADAGVTWSSQTSNTGVVLNDVVFTTDLEGWAVGVGATVRHTTDGGANWGTVIPGATENLHGVWFATRDTGWAVGNLGAVVRTFDRGATWSKQNLPTAGGALNDVSFIGTRFGWAVGDNGFIFATTDRGISWTAVTPAITAANLKSVWRQSFLRANAVGATGAAPRCADDGVGNPEWTLVNPGALFQIEGVCFATDLIGWCVGLNGTGFVLRSGDGGQSWAPQTATASSSLNAVYFIDSEHGWAVGNGGVILHTATGGQP